MPRSLSRVSVCKSRLLVPGDPVPLVEPVLLEDVPGDDVLDEEVPAGDAPAGDAPADCEFGSLAPDGVCCCLVIHSSLSLEEHQAAPHGGAAE
jgi:hypothetical protein